MLKSLKIIIIALVAVVAIALAAAVYFLWLPLTAGTDDRSAAGITWGVDFSQAQAEYLQLDWKKTYLALINDLGARHIKLHTNWDWVEGKQKDFYFKDIDWQIKQAEQKKVKIIYVIGLKTGRWPECHSPAWVNSLSAQAEQSELLHYIQTVVNRYKRSKAIAYWQVENEPFLQFGQCPDWYYQSDHFLKAQVALVKSLDPSRQIIISDSGELSDWSRAARIGDIVGITMYRNAWVGIKDTFGFDASYSFLNPAVYKKKAALIQEKFGKKVICIELQAEPWASRPFLEAPLSEQFASMNPALFEENVAFAKKTGLDTFYFWGSEWWYWLKEKQNKPQVWEEAKKLFNDGVK